MDDNNTVVQSASTRFITAYNLLDHSLRLQYNFKTTISFSDLIRRCASLNQVIRVYEDELIDFARLRNAIVHSKSEQIIAEPHEDVVELIEKVARIISTPPYAIDVIKSRHVDIISWDAYLRDYIVMSSSVGHSNIPVYKKDMLIGVLERHRFLENLGKVMQTGKDVDDYFAGTTVETYLKNYPSTEHFTIVSTRITIEEVIALFSNRRLTAIVITSDGTSGGKLQGIITTADIIKLVQTIEDY